MKTYAVFIAEDKLEIIDTNDNKTRYNELLKSAQHICTIHASNFDSVQEIATAEYNRLFNYVT